MTDEIFYASLQEKLARLRDAMRSLGVDAAVIQRRSNFAWLTTGGHSAVATIESLGACAVVVEPERLRLIAKSMDADRIYLEELREVPGAFVTALKWYERSVEEELASSLEGRNFLSDAPLFGRTADTGFFEALHDPLNEVEIKRYQELGAISEQAMLEACDSIEPGMTEEAAFSILAAACARRGITNAVRLLGADERPRLYKHSTPGPKKIARYGVLAAAFQKWGLTAPISRAVYFGSSLPEPLEARHEAARAIAAESIDLCRTGARFYDISMRQKELFARYGFEGEWLTHFQGGLTGYIINDSRKCLDPAAKVGRLQAFNWYVTILGAKVEETTLALPGGAEMVTNTGLFPSSVCPVAGGTVRIPRILLR